MDQCSHGRAADRTCSHVFHIGWLSFGPQSLLSDWLWISSEPWKPCSLGSCRWWPFDIILSTQVESSVIACRCVWGNDSREDLSCPGRILRNRQIWSIWLASVDVSGNVKTRGYKSFLYSTCLARGAWVEVSWWRWPWLSLRSFSAAEGAVVFTDGRPKLQTGGIKVSEISDPVTREYVRSGWSDIISWTTYFWRD